jgi:hypothetical protein
MIAWLRHLFGCGICGKLGHGASAHCPKHPEWVGHAFEPCSACLYDSAAKSYEQKRREDEAMAEHIATKVAEKLKATGPDAPSSP